MARSFSISKNFYFRSFSIGFRTLFSMDMLRCTVLHGQYYAFMHNIHRSIFIIALSNAFWTKQNKKACHCENYIRLDFIDCDELTIELDVFKGELQFIETKHNKTMTNMKIQNIQKTKKMQTKHHNICSFYNRIINQ